MKTVFNSDTDILVETEEDILVEKEDQKKIILFNDDYNTFDYVIQCLVEVCEHEMEQAEQCTVLVHYKGRCDVKRGSYTELEPKCSELLRRGLTAEIH